jgi:TolB-like protein
MTSLRGRSASQILSLLIAALIGCGPTTPYRVKNYFRDSEIEERNLRRIAVLPFENLTLAPEAGVALTDEFNLQLGRLGVFDLVERARIEELFREQDVDTLRFDPSSVCELGRMLGAQAVILGSVTRFEPHPKVPRETIEVVHHYPPPVIIYDYDDEEEKEEEEEEGGEKIEPWEVAVAVLAIISVVGILYLLLREEPKSAEVGLSARLVDVETGKQLWIAKECIRGADRSVQVLIEDETERQRAVRDTQFLAQVLCREMVKTILESR